MKFIQLVQAIYLWVYVILRPATVAPVRAPHNIGKENKEKDDGAREAAPASSVAVASENGGSMQLVRVSVPISLDYKSQRVFGVCFLAVDLVFRY